MKKSKKNSIASYLLIGMSSLVLLSCDDKNGDIVRSYDIDGNWLYNGLTYKVETNLVPVDNIITEDIHSRNLNSSCILNFDSKKMTYIITESKMVKDSGRYIIDTEKVKFESKFRSKPLIEDTEMYIDANNLKLTYDAKKKYEDKKLLDSLGVANPDAVIIFQANYSYIFKKPN